MIAKLSAIEFDGVHCPLSLKGPKDVIGHQNDLVLSLNPANAEDVDIQLPVLAQPPALRALVAPQVGNTVPAQRVGQFLALGCYHPADSRGHLRTNNNFAATAVSKAIGLFVDNFFTSFGQIQLQRLQNRRIVFFVTEFLHRAADSIKHEFLFALVLWIEVASAFVGLGR